MKTKLPKRKPLRLHEYDYSHAGLYFITICSNDKKCLFGFIEDGEMLENEAGRMLVNWWKKLPEKFTNVELDEFVVMPNHFHGIIFIPDGPTHGSAPTIPNVIQWFKTMTTNSYIQLVKQNFAKKFNQKLWQRSYYDHVIRNEKSLKKIREYVIENPRCWEKDENFML